MSEDNLAVAKLEAHYFLTNCFMPDNYILDNIDTIKHIPCYVVQGRFDNCTPPDTAYRLSKAYGKTLHCNGLMQGIEHQTQKLWLQLELLQTQGLCSTTCFCDIAHNAL